MADYKQQVQSYALEVKRIQDSLAGKEGERTNLLEQYRLLSLEADRFQSQSHQAESEASNYKLQLKTREADVRSLKEKVEQLVVQLEEVRSDCRDYFFELLHVRVTSFND